MNFAVKFFISTRLQPGVVAAADKKPFQRFFTRAVLRVRQTVETVCRSIVRAFTRLKPGANEREVSVAEETC